ncbi:hypothetical protein R1flu_019068 [Riccia fluitans]|uniref:Uncharacterized protein n=1 Tax=Riccia fluitans TaxID=41844 RepID=A0ABD1ZHM8_9MARC
MEVEEGFTKAEGGVPEPEAGNMEGEKGVTKAEGGVTEVEVENMEAEGGVTKAESGNMEVEEGITKAKAGNLEAKEGVTEADGGAMEADLKKGTEAEGGVTEPHLEEATDREGGITEAKEVAREMGCVVEHNIVHQLRSITQLQTEREKDQALARPEVRDAAVLAQFEDQTTTAMEANCSISSLVAEDQLIRLQNLLAESQWERERLKIEVIRPLKDKIWELATQLECA